MTAAPETLSARQAALVAAYGYAAIFVLAIFANFFVRERLVDPDDASGTLENIAGSETLFRFGLVAFLLVFLVDVAIAWALYVFFRPVRADLSLLTAWFRLVYTVMLGAALVFFFAALEVAVGDGSSRPGEAGAHVTLFFEAFDYLWLVGLAAFGIHLALLGVLVFRSVGMPGIIGWLLVAAGTAYVVDTVARSLLASYDDYGTVFLALVAVPSVIGELSFAVWLLLRGGRRPVTPKAL